MFEAVERVGQMVSVRRAAEMIGVTPSKLYQMIAEERFPSIQFDRCIRIELEDLRQWKAEHRMGGAQ